MIIDTTKLSKKENYRLLTNFVIPRPIAWISTRGQDGIANLAPYSFHNVASTDPPAVMFVTDQPEGVEKDTLRNVLDTEEFVVNHVSMDLAKAMKVTAGRFESHINEFEEAGIEMADCDIVKAPRVAASIASMECKLIHQWTPQNAKERETTMIIGEVLRIHIRDGILDDELKADFDQMHSVGRLGGRGYTSIDPMFEL